MPFVSPIFISFFFFSFQTSVNSAATSNRPPASAATPALAAAAAAAQAIAAHTPRGNLHTLSQELQVRALPVYGLFFVLVAHPTCFNGRPFVRPSVCRHFS